MHYEIVDCTQRPCSGENNGRSKRRNGSCHEYSFIKTSSKKMDRNWGCGFKIGKCHTVIINSASQPSMASDGDFLLSDLTECESDESSVAGKGKKPAKKTGWRVKKALQPARATTYSAQSLYSEHWRVLVWFSLINFAHRPNRCWRHRSWTRISEKCNLSTRGYPLEMFIVIADLVWPKSKQIMIIDSILQLLYPPIIFAVKNHDDGSESKTWIDGKQRLASIHRFVCPIFLHTKTDSKTGLWMDLYVYSLSLISLSPNCPSLQIPHTFPNFHPNNFLYDAPSYFGQRSDKPVLLIVHSNVFMGWPAKNCGSRKVQKA